jgi:tetratricopeptide (TPR) repeat protein
MKQPPITPIGPLLAVLCALASVGELPAEPSREAGESYRAGYELMSIRDFRGAASEFERAVAADSTYGDAYFALGQSYLTLNQYGRAVGALDKALQIGLSNPDLQKRLPSRLADAYKKWGVTSLSQRKFREAISAFEKSLQLQPDDARMQFNLGLCYGQLHESAAAQAAFERAIDVDPAYVKPYKSLGDIHRRARVFGRSLEFYHGALAIDSTFTEARAGVALVQIESRDFEAALKTLERLVRIDSTSAYGHLLLGHTLNQLKRYHEAEAPLLRTSIDLDGDNGEAHFRLAESYYGTGEYRQAVKAGVAATRKRRDYRAAQVVLADAYVELGETTNARTWYLEAASDSRFRDYCNHRIELLAKTR